MKLITERECYNCGCELEYKNLSYGICEKCLSSIKMIDIFSSCPKCGLPNAKNWCYFCANQKLNMDRNISLYTYDGIIRNIIQKIKFNNETQKIRIIKRLTQNVVLDKIFGEPIDIIVPVPSSLKAFLKRGFDLIELIFKPLARKNRKKFERVIGRKLFAKQQKKLSRDERLRLAKEQFFVRKKREEIKGKTVLIVDDVFTTGSTLNVCSSIIKTLGAGKVFSLTLARSIEEF
ncbi:MAG: ComF family protein [Brevinematia bacterium]